MKPARKSRQEGATLLVSVMMLVLITMLALTSYRLGSGNLKIVGNMQERNQTFAAAQSTIEHVLSNPGFTGAPNNAIAEPCNGIPNTRCVDVNGDGTSDVTVRVGSLQPTGELNVAPCVQQVKPVANATLDYSKPEDASCAVGVGQTYGIAGANSGSSMCAETLWGIDAVATDATVGATSVVSAGVRVRTSSDDVSATNNCR